MEQPKTETKIEGVQGFAERLINEEQILLNSLENGNFKVAQSLIVMSRLAQKRAKEY